MRRKPTIQVERMRDRDTSDETYGNNGRFLVAFPDGDGVFLQVVISDGGGWDHVSVSTPHRCPTWAEMEYVRGLFFKETETVMQLSVPRDEHINRHPFCLHWWRPQSVTIPRPPAYMV